MGRMHVSAEMAAAVRKVPPKWDTSITEVFIPFAKPHIDKKGVSAHTSRDRMQSMATQSQVIDQREWG